MLDYIVRNRPQEVINQSSIETSPCCVGDRDYQSQVLGIGTNMNTLSASQAVQWFNSNEHLLPQSGRTQSMLEPWDFNSHAHLDSS